MRIEGAPRAHLSSSFAVASQLGQQGRFADALVELERAPADKAHKLATDVLRAQLLERTGRYAHSRSLLTTILATRDLSPADRSTCELVLARLEWDSAKIDAAETHLQRSIQNAKQAQDLQRLWLVSVAASGNAS